MFKLNIFLTLKVFTLNFKMFEFFNKEPVWAFLL